jgi:hypothetical protein
MLRRERHAAMAKLEKALGNLGNGEKYLGELSLLE